jgi:hypothetical protein
MNTSPTMLTLVSKQSLTKPFAGTSMVTVHLPVPFFKTRSSLDNDEKDLL